MVKIYQPALIYPSASQVITYTSNNKVETIKEGLNSVKLFYGPGQQRAKMEINKVVNVPLAGDVTVLESTRYYAGAYEKNVKAVTNASREIVYVGSPTGICAMLVKNGNVDSTYYVYTDHLGSITGITDANNVSKDKRSYDAWGRLRDENWSYPNVKTRYGFNTLTDRGYTAHEEMNEFNLVNMNGRVYDPLVGAMLQPDVVIQDAGNSQSYNRYSYCRNNPLRYSDPSGYSYINYGFANAYQAVQQFLWKNNAIYLHVNGKRIRYSDPLYASIDRQSAFAFQIGGGLRPKPMPEGNVNLEFSHVNETVARDRNRSERRAAAVAGYMAQGGGVPSGDWNHRDYDAGGDGNSPGLRGGGDDAADGGGIPGAEANLMGGPTGIDGPSSTQGGFIDDNASFITFMKAQARNNGVEVSAFQMKDGRYFVQPWSGNSPRASINNSANIPGMGTVYGDSDIEALWHTHPGSSWPSEADANISQYYNVPVRTIGANGSMYEVFYPPGFEIPHLAGTGFDYGWPYKP